ncbi:MAG: CHASE2 domain-containing protein [Cyanobacteria bacterium J06649_4]
MPSPSYRYQIGGSLTVDAPCYVERPADASLYEALTAGEFCYVLNSRQMGKSSLLVRTKNRLEQQGVRCVAIDLTGIGELGATPERWYKGVFLQICLGLDLLAHFKFKVWWQDHDDLPLVQRMALFIKEIVLPAFPDQSIVIFVDEIDTVQGLSFSSDEFFAFIRFCFNQRSLDPTYNRITFALFGVATPSDLIKDPQRTPFNIGQAIALEGFSLSETTPLMKGFKLPHGQSFEILKEILNWTGGQPFLTQKLCKMVEEDTPQPTAEIVAALVQSEIIEAWESKDDPEHLATISSRILTNARTASRLLGMYQRILAHEEIKANHSPEQLELLLSGLVVAQNGILKTKNRIYESVFNPQWVQHQLEQRRPYAENFNAWLSSEQQQSDHLLQGLALQEALAWAQDKQLSDLDYRFLGASQALANQFANQALTEEKQERELAEVMVRSLQAATQLFSQARAQAKRRSRRAKLGRGWIGTVAAGVAGGVLLLRLTGLLQGLEWAAFDQIVQRRPSQGIDPRITLITIDEPDIRAAGSFPLSGTILANLLQVLNRYEPRGIGLDVYRDVPVEPGHADFLKEVARSPNLIGIEHIINTPIAALPALSAEQVGFGDQVVDGDGTIRRGLISMTAQEDTSPHLSFGVRLALKYLAEEGITPVSIGDSQMQLGQATLQPFEPKSSGFYVAAEDGGYQMLINYHGPEAGFQRLSLTAVLAEDFSPEAVRDRLVLIGYTAESVNDLFPSPYSNRMIGSAQPMAGITVHANMASQLLSAALEGKPLLRTWPKGVEWIWIMSWAVVGAALTWKIRFLTGQILGVAIALISVAGIAVFAFTQGYWIPLVPAILTLVGAAMILPVATAKQIESLQLRETINILVNAAQTDPAVDPTVGKIAIAYLKQVEGQDPKRLALIENHLKRLDG